MIQAVDPVVSLPYQWKPRFYQENIWNFLKNQGKRAVLRWHRRTGKDDVCLHHTACSMEERVGNYWYMLPKYDQCRKAMWEAINPWSGKKRIDEAFPRALRAQTKDQEMLIRWHNGSTFQLVGADSYNALVGSPPIGLVFSEYARTDPAAWAYLMPILEENGGWVIFNSTPYGDNHYTKMCESVQAWAGWFYEQLTADQTSVYTAEQLQRFRQQLIDLHGEAYGHALWRQEYYCDDSGGLPGAIWADCLVTMEQDGRILDFPFDSSRPVYTAWDIGRTDDTAIWWYQMVGSEVLVVNHHSSSLKDIDFYVDLLVEKQAQYNMTYVKHWLPHDARPRRFGMGAGSVLQQFQYYARMNPTLGLFDIGRMLDRQEGIQAGRKTFKSARFHRTNCKAGLKSLRHYHREWDDVKKKFTDVPMHDWASHDADAWRYLSLAWQAEKPDVPVMDLERQMAVSCVTKRTFGELVATHLRKKRLERAA
jgi:hypothetical protein